MEKSGQYFSCVFHNGFRLDMNFLTKGLWWSLWQTQDVSLLGSCLTTIKSYTLGRHVKFIDSVKYYQQHLSELARSTDSSEKERIQSLIFDYFAFQHLYYSQFFLSDLTKEDRNFVLEYLSSSKGCFPYEIVSRFDSLSARPEDRDFWEISPFTLGFRMGVSLRKSGRVIENFTRLWKWEIPVMLTTSITYRTFYTRCHLGV